MRQSQDWEGGADLLCPGVLQGGLPLKFGKDNTKEDPKDHCLDP